MALGRKTGGRTKGARNKATIERDRRAALEEKALLDTMKGRVSDAQANPIADLTGHAIQPLAKDELSALIPIVKGIVNRFQRAAMMAGEAGAPDRERFAFWRCLDSGTLATC